MLRTWKRIAINLTKVFPLGRTVALQQYPLLQSLQTATTGQDIRLPHLLIGVEYINGQPYLHSMVTIVWEP